MLKAQPAAARYVHEAHAITRAQLEALEAAGALAVAGEHEGARSLLAKMETHASPDRVTPLDVVVVSEARTLAKDALTGTSFAHAIPALESLSLVPRDVSERAEMRFVGRALRLKTLLRVDAPSIIIENELALLQAAMLRLDSLQSSADPDDDPFLPDDEIGRFSDARFALSLGAFAGVIDAVADFHREERPADGSEVFALGGPLLESLDEGVEAHRMWRDWMVMEGLEGLDNVRETIGVLRADLLEVPLEMREQLVDSTDCALAPLVTCEDWIPELDARLVALEDDLASALQEGLVIVSRVKRDLAY